MKDPFVYSCFDRKFKIENDIFYGHCAHYAIYYLNKCFNLGINFDLKSSDLYEMIETKKFTQEIVNISPGQIFVWKKKTPPKNGDTGHCGIIESWPLEIKKNYYQVKVRDMSKSAHDNECESRPGITSGDIYLKTRDGKVIGVQWGGQSKKIKITEILFWKP